MMKPLILAISTALTTHLLSLCIAVSAMGIMWQAPHDVRIEMPSHVMTCCKPAEHPTEFALTIPDRRTDSTAFDGVNEPIVTNAMPDPFYGSNRAPPSLALANPFHTRTTIQRK